MSRVEYLDKIPSRADQLAKLAHGTESDPFDVLIIGGGATGTGCAVDAITRSAAATLVAEALLYLTSLQTDLLPLWELTVRHVRIHCQCMLHAMLNESCPHLPDKSQSGLVTQGAMATWQPPRSLQTSVAGLS